MNTNFFRGILFIFWMKPILAKIAISPEKRVSLYKKLFWDRYFYIDNHLNKKCPEDVALNIFKQYIFDGSGFMFTFTRSLENLGHTRDSYNKKRLRDPAMYEKLRYNVHIEVWLNKQEAVERISNIYTLEEMNFINMSPQKLFDDYMTEKLFDTVTFEDYYALNNFVYNDYSTLNINIPMVWRIKKAIYRLAIRQLDAIDDLMFPKILYSTKCLDSESLQNVISRSFYDSNDFIVCNENEGIEAQHSCFNGTTKMNYKVVLTQPFIAVNLNNVFKNLSQYILTPKLHFVIDKLENVTIGQTVEYFITIRSFKINRAAWLASTANNVFLYTEMENNRYVFEEFEQLNCSNRN